MVETNLLSPQIGAVIGTSAEPVSLADVETIRACLDDRLVVVLPGQTLDPPTLHEFMDGFGPAHIHHADDDVLFVRELPEVLEMRKDPDGERLFGGGGWHADVTFQEPCGAITGLYASVVPPVGGDTLFANAIAAFEAMSPRMQDLLRELRAIHSYDGPGCPDRNGLTAVHPVVRRHPATGHEGLYVNTMFVTRFEGMTPEETHPLLQYLEAHITRPERVCRVQWEPGHLVLWDNRFT
ncbi:MAG: TauD/TfdA dioxygenase family protein, partial [Acidimicrobiales bacterium]